VALSDTARLRRLTRDVRRRLGRLTDRLLDGDPFTPDEYVQRLLVSVAGMTEPGNLGAFDRAIRTMPDGAVVEIGVFCGQSALLLDHLLRVHGRDNRLFCTDIWICLGTRDGDAFASESERGAYLASVAGRGDLSRDAYMAFIKQRFIANSRFFAGDRLPAGFDLSSNTFFSAWTTNEPQRDLFDREIQLGGPIAFAYIDGDHSYAQARKDLDNAAAHMPPGALVLLDDSWQGCGMGSAQVALEAMKDPRFEFVEARPNYLFRRR
jgi:hypothetical protein